jgi:hypothetical protein
MNRRGFLATLRGVFTPQSDGDPFFFGMQCVINVYGEDELRARFHRIIAEAPERERPHEKRAHYKRISALLREHVASIEYGYWDYLTDADEASGEFDEWVVEIEASSATVEEELGEEIDEAFRLSNEKDYIVVTLVFLLEHGREHVTLEEMLASIPEEHYFTPWGFQKLIDAIGYIDFERSLGDGVFILPGSDGDGFSWTDMRAPGWDYLRPVMGSIE